MIKKNVHVTCTKLIENKAVATSWMMGDLMLVAGGWAGRAGGARRGRRVGFRFEYGKRQDF